MEFKALLGLKEPQVLKEFKALLAVKELLEHKALRVHKEHKASKEYWAHKVYKDLVIDIKPQVLPVYRLALELSL